MIYFRDRVDVPTEHARQTMTALILCGLIVNAVFLIFHPAWSSSYPAFLQSLGINIVIFLAPALPFLGTLISREGLPSFALLWAMLISFAVLIGVLGFFHLTGWPLTANGAWNVTWAVTNILLLIAVWRGLQKEWQIDLTSRSWPLFFSLFLGTYGLYLYGAMYVVPEQYDHDLEVQATGYGLLTRFRTSVADRPEYNLLFRPSTPSPLLRRCLISLLRPVRSPRVLRCREPTRACGCAGKAV